MSVPISSKGYYNLFFYFNVSSIDWLTVNNYFFSKQRKIVLLTSKEKEFLNFSFFKTKNLTLFMSTQCRDNIFCKSHMEFIDMNLSILLKKKLILNNVLYKNFVYSSYVTHIVFNINKYDILKKYIEYLKISNYVFLSIIVYLFLKSCLFYYTKIFLISNNRKLIYNLFLYI